MLDQPRAVIRAMTWNTWWRFGGNWREREPGILQVVRRVEADVLGIQECWGDARRTQASVIADQLSAHSAFVRVGLPPAPDPVEYPDQAEVAMGLGLVSRWPIVAVREAPLPSEGRLLRALVATIEHPLGELRVVVGATSWEPERADETAAQVAELQRLVVEGAAERMLPSLLLADLNYDRDQPPLAGLTLRDGWEGADPESDSRTLSSENRFAPPEAVDQYDRRIDHVAYEPGRAKVRAINARVIRDDPGGLPPSDHYPVVVDLEIGAQP
jgi:endonuclease/exonuclease/phosphatase family metal-dependent hydrolase